MRWELPYPSRRQPVLAERVVATSQPLAAQAGLLMLQRGGSAVDAAVATAAALTVVEPTSNGIGGDAFAIVADASGVWGLNASGRSPAALDPEPLIGRPAMPLRGWSTVTVPGAVSAWVALWRRFGRLELADLLAPAISYARDGWLVGPVTAAAWALAPDAYAGFDEFAAAFLPEGRAPSPGDRFALPDQARTLELIAATEGDALYRGELAERLAAHAERTGGALRGVDLAAHEPEWVSTLRLPYAGHVVHELPPNGQGIAALLALALLDRLDVSAADVDGADWLHLQIEAMKLAFAEAHAEVADPDAMRTDPERLLDADRISGLARRIDRRRAADPGHGQPPPGGTVYLATGDADGMMVSFIQSNYYGFGSGIVVPDTGIALQNRGAGFSTRADHPNAVAPGKRPFHTIIPGLLERDGRPLAAFGVMGGPMQPQGHVQLALRTLDHEQSPQAAVDAPRWRVEAGFDVAVEPGLPADAMAELERRGHHVHVGTPGDVRSMGAFGGAQVVWRLPTGWLAASDPRKEGQAVGS